MRQIGIEEQQLFPAVLSIMAPADWADLHIKLREQNEALCARGLVERLRGQRRWIERQAPEARDVGLA
jgi:hypothetical protein